jgi:hypothetical protein
MSLAQEKLAEREAAAPTPDAKAKRGPWRARSSYLTPEERRGRLVATGWTRSWIATVWGISERELASWIDGTTRPRPNFDKWLSRMANVIDHSLPSRHPLSFKPPAVRFKDMA